LRAKVIEKKRKNDIVLVAVGCTENHGLHNNRGLNTFIVMASIYEAARRKMAKAGHEVALAFPPLNYSEHLLSPRHAWHRYAAGDDHRRSAVRRDDGVVGRRFP